MSTMTSGGVWANWDTALGAAARAWRDDRHAGHDLPLAPQVGGAHTGSWPAIVR
ncbi:MAG TPA: hypothetical protein VMO26_13775 [Vicinamibacterales bacterium]|nr:hypothetical protein [Vicinamibacterales bacterium]